MNTPSTPIDLGKYSIGIGDRFGREASAQLRALEMAKQKGVDITPVWNKSFREHSIIGTKPADTRRAVDIAVGEMNWKDPYFMDADHIGLKTVDLFMEYADFFTIDVADFIGGKATPSDEGAFLESAKKLLGRITVPGLRAPIETTGAVLAEIAGKYLLPVKEAGKIYRHICAMKGATPFVTEISMDEALKPQTPSELLFILAAIAQEGIPIRTIAPKFSGEFLKGIDYVGSVDRFAEEFEQDLHVIAYAVRQFGLPHSLKISVHSGSDKFSLYPVIGKAMRANNAGLHLKTAGTTWLEEVLGLAIAGPEGLRIAQSVYKQAFERIDELSKPYASVIAIDRGKLPTPQTVNNWSGVEFAAALKHDRTNPSYNLHLRQLVHIAFRIAAEMGDTYQQALSRNRTVVAAAVTENLWKRHITPLFIS
jgi:hypothetical protein